MSEEGFRLPLTEPGTYSELGRIRLRGDKTGVYDLARAGAEGWIRARTLDPVGEFPMVYVEWDKDHWAYNGQSDIWTYEDHFERANEEKMSNNNEQIRKALQVLAGALGVDEKPASPPQGQLRAVPDL